MMAVVEFIASLGGFGWVVSAGLCILLLLSILYVGIWRPYKLHTFYRSHNLKGPPHRPLMGNLPEIRSLRGQIQGMKWETADPADLAARCLPHLTYWSKLYGKIFTYMEGAKVNLCVLDTEVIKEILIHKPDCYRRSPSGWLWLNSHGAGGHWKQEVIDTKMIQDDPEHWAILRRIWGPQSDKDHVQDCLHTIVRISKVLVRKWDKFLEEAPDGLGRVQVDFRRDIKKTSMEVFLANLLGSTMSTDQREALYQNLREDEEDTVTTTTSLLDAQFPSMRLSREAWLIRLLTETIEARLKSKSQQMDGQEEEEANGKDLLDLMIPSFGPRSTPQDLQKLVAYCQMLIVAQKATAQLIAQTMLLLARHTDWQIQARAEILEIRPLDSPINEDGEDVSSRYPNLAKLKIMNMILNESLRLYPPVLCTEKLCEKRHRLGKYTVLPGTFVQIPIVLVHHMPELWGEDALSFRPDRFADGAGGRRPFALLPFSAGPSVCVGYNMALQEAKIVLASILTSFAFDLVPNNLTTTSSMSNNCLLIRRLDTDDVAAAAKLRLTRRLSSSVQWEQEREEKCR